MRDLEIDRIVEIYKAAGDLMYLATINGDYKTNNREIKKLRKLFMFFKKDRDFGEDCIDKLMSIDNVVIRIEVAAYCLSLNYRIDEAIENLNSISKNKEYGIFSFNAEMTLKEWNKKGYLRLYQKK